MHLPQELLTQSWKARALRLAVRMGNDPDWIGALMDVFFWVPYRLTRRTAAVLNSGGLPEPGPEGTGRNPEVT